MKVLVTGSAGHLGEALVRTLQNTSHEVLGLDIIAPPAQRCWCGSSRIFRWATTMTVRMGWSKPCAG
jgi:hypothetical protein